MQLAIVILSTYEGDYLRVSLPRTKRALPDAKIFVVTPVDDGESQAIATAMRAQTISVPKETFTKDNAVFNFAGLTKLGQEHAQNNIKAPCWIVVTRAQICLDESIGNIDLTSLETDAVYGAGVKEVISNAALVTFKCEEPSAEEVRTLIPDCNFLMSYSNGPKFDAWSTNTNDGVTRFLNNFGSKYMIQKKMAHLGLLNADIDERNTHRWGDPRAKVRITPVHPATAAKTEQPKEEPKPEEVKSEAKKEEVKPDTKPEEVKPEAKKEEVKPDAKKEEVKPDNKPEAKPEEKKEAKPEEKKEDIKPEEVKSEVKTEEPLYWKQSKYFKASKFAVVEDEESNSSKARAEPDEQQNVPLATATLSEKMDDDNGSQKYSSFYSKKFVQNPWKQ